MRKIEIDEYQNFYSVRILGNDEYVIHFRMDGTVREAIAIRFGEYGFYKPDEFEETYPNELKLAKSYFDTYLETKQDDFFKGMTRQYKDEL